VSELQYATVISPNDQMWQSGAQWYFDVGLSAMTCIKRALALHNLTPRAILDMPCGHGRVCRMLRAAYPDAHITACDLDPDGVDFCAQTFGATPVYSREDIRTVTIDRQFDVIWCGSLFTHLDRELWADFLTFFADHLGPDGVLVFTTHGRQPVKWIVDKFFDYGLSRQEQRTLLGGYATEGFGFVMPGNQAFGISLSSIAFVCGEIERRPDLTLLGYQEAAWAGHQDVVSCMRLRDPYVDPAQLAR